MSKKLDLYLEKIIAKMNLDDAQRESVEREFRAHLEEAIREGVEKGLTGEQAETEAMRSFGQPSFIAHQFGITHGFAWYVFESIALSILIYFIIITTTRAALINAIERRFIFYYIFWGKFLGVLFSIWFLSTRLWNKIEVNGTLRLRRLFFRHLSIPFEAIEKISLGGRNLWGRRKINIYFKGEMASIYSGIRNFRCAALALDALCPHAVEKGVISFFRKIPYKIPKEGKWFRWGMTLFWLSILLFYSWFLIPVWNLNDFSLLYPLTMLLVIPGLIFQMTHHKDRAKRGVLIILLVVYCFYFISLIWQHLFFTLKISFKALLLWFYGFIGTFLFFTWWKGRRGYLISFIVLSFIILYPFRFFLTSSEWNGEKKILMKGPFSLYLPLWIDDSTLYAINAGLGKPLFLIHQGNESLMVHIDEHKNMMWGIDKKNTQSEAALIYVPYFHNKMDPNDSSKVFLHSREKGLRKEDLISTSVQFLPTIFYNFPLFSPDDKYMITPLVRKGSEGNNVRKHDLAFTNMENGTVARFDNMNIRRASGWIDGKTFEIYYCSPRTEDNEVKETLIQICRFHPEAERYEISKILTVPGKVEILEWTSGNFVPVVFHPNQEIGFIDLNTSDTLRKNHFAQSMQSGFAYSWHDKTKKLAILCRGESHHNIAIIEPDKETQIFPLEKERIIRMMNFSPDGSKIFALSINSSLGIDPKKYISLKHLHLPLVHLEVIDLKRGKRITIEHTGIFQSLAPFLSGTFCGALHNKQWLLWTPDSRSVVYQYLHINLMEKKAFTATEFHIAHYEDWAEKNL